MGTAEDQDTADDGQAQQPPSDPTETAHPGGAERRGDAMIDWELAATTAAKVAPPGPRLSRREVADEVAALRTAAAEAVGHVHRITGLQAAEGLGAADDALVVDRPTWSRANTQSFRTLLGPALDAVAQKRPGAAGRNGKSRSGPEQSTPQHGASQQGAPQHGAAQTVGAAVAGAELGGVLAFLSAHVLGQFDPFTQGRLLLVAPNVVEVRRELNVVPEDFRLWVCLHEQTHRVQFAAAPWLAEHLQGKVQELSTNTMNAATGMAERLTEVFRHLKDDLAERRSEQHRSQESGSGGSRGNRLLQLLQSPEDREIVSHLTAAMSLLEGHANVVMDAVDSTIVPSVKTIRRRFEARGKDRSPLERLIRRMLQLDVKAAQYRDGQKFVGHIVETVGMEQFNTIWESPEHLPTEEELHAPDTWIDRMGLTR